MIFGSVSLNENAVVTHRDSYLLKSLSVVSVRRVFLAPGILFGRRVHQLWHCIF